MTNFWLRVALQVTIEDDAAVHQGDTRLLKVLLRHDLVVKPGETDDDSQHPDPNLTTLQPINRDTKMNYIDRGAQLSPRSNERVTAYDGHGKTNSQLAEDSNTDLYNFTPRKVLHINAPADERR